MPNLVTVIQQPSVLISELSIGQGPAGPPGSLGSDSNYVHDQMVPSALWVIQHNLGKFPSVTVFDSSGAEVEGFTAHTNAFRLTIEFSAAFSGIAYLN